MQRVVAPRFLPAELVQYDQNIFIEKLDAFLEFKSEEKIDDASASQFKLTQFKKDFPYAIKAIRYRKEKFKKENYPDGYCFGLLLMFWFHAIDNKKNEFFDMMNIIRICPAKCIRFVEKEFREVLVELEMIQWVEYYTRQRENQDGFNVSLKWLKNLRLRKTSVTKNIDLNANELVKMLNELPNKALLMLDFDHRTGRHAVGVIRMDNDYLFYDANLNVGAAKYFTYRNLDKIFNEELLIAFYKNFNVKIPKKKPLTMHLASICRYELKPACPAIVKPLNSQGIFKNQIKFPPILKKHHAPKILSARL